jgi:hypothetical protein
MFKSLALKDVRGNSAKRVSRYNKEEVASGRQPLLTRKEENVLK